jgi:uncharacterized membrane protein YccC
VHCNTTSLDFALKYSWRASKTPLLIIQDMAKARVQLQRQAEQLAIHQDDINEDDAEETLDESGDPLEESGRTVDSSDEEIDDSVADDIVRFEQSFEGINKRYRLINRVGEGENDAFPRTM